MGPPASGGTVAKADDERMIDLVKWTRERKKDDPTEVCNLNHTGTTGGVRWRFRKQPMGKPFSSGQDISIEALGNAHMRSTPTRTSCPRCLPFAGTNKVHDAASCHATRYASNEVDLQNNVENQWTTTTKIT